MKDLRGGGIGRRARIVRKDAVLKEGLVKNWSKKINILLIKFII
jgi:hypothetical protein